MLRSLTCHPVRAALIANVQQPAPGSETSDARQAAAQLCQLLAAFNCCWLVPPLLSSACQAFQPPRERLYWQSGLLLTS